MSRWESKLLHGQPPRGLTPRPETGCGLPVAVPEAVSSVGVDRRAAMDRMGAYLHEHAAAMPSADREAITRQAARRHEAQSQGRPHGHIVESTTTRSGR